MCSIEEGVLTKEEIELVIDQLCEEGAFVDIDRVVRNVTEGRETIFNNLRKDVRSDILNECDECDECNMWSRSIDYNGRCSDCAAQYEDEGEEEDE